MGTRGIEEEDEGTEDAVELSGESEREEILFTTSSIILEASSSTKLGVGEGMGSRIGKDVWLNSTTFSPNGAS